MPQEKKHRGRREAEKRKRDEAEPWSESKRQNLDEDVEIIVDDDHPKDFYQAFDRPDYIAQDLPFYGLLDEQEQEYFKSADTVIELNQFNDSEERGLFLSNVFKEADGKELKIANSQSCSRIMERLILLSTSVQLKAIFQKFSGHFLNLIQHRFASHCCEALFLRAAFITSEEASLEMESSTSMETMFLNLVSELKPQLGFLVSDTFASHPLRVLLAILSGMPLEASKTTSTLQSKKKEHISIPQTLGKASESDKTRYVPTSFSNAVDEILHAGMADLDTSSLRALSTQPVANPVLQIMLELELTRSGKKDAKNPNSLFCKLLPDDPLVEGTESAAFFEQLLYDPVGSRLLEVIMTHAPGKTFKAIYKNLLSERIGTVARNETAVFVVVKVIERLSKDDLQTAMRHILDKLDVLVKRSRTIVIKTLIERCRVREVDLQPIADSFQTFYGSQLPRTITELLEIGNDDDVNISADRRKQIESHDFPKTHISLLFQSMLEMPSPLRDLFNDALLQISTSDLISMAKDRAASRVLQSALTCKDQTVGFRRLLMKRFAGTLSSLATDIVASHFVDAMWDGSSGMKFARETIAEELLRDESSIRDSIPGRAVWRNWKMDLYKTRRRDWADESTSGGKTDIELARDRHATQKSKHWQKAEALLRRPPQKRVVEA